MERNPELILAAVGTTSSGKSTLLNLLAGRWLLPIDVQESPRIVIEIRHQTRREATFADGTRVPHDEAARHRVVHLAAEGLRTRSSSEPVVLDLAARLRLAPVETGWAAILGRLLERVLPPRPVQPCLPTPGIRLRDLPGVLHEDDAAAWQIIRPRLCDSFILTVLDARETNPRLEDYLLRSVITAVAEWDGDWQRLFFLLNRVDVFPHDEAGQASLRQREAILRRRIARILRDAGCPVSEAEPLLHRVAAWPALIGEVLANSDGNEPDKARAYLLGRAVDCAGRLPGCWPLEAGAWRRRHLHAYHQAAADVYHWRSFRQALCQQVACWWHGRVSPGEKMLHSAR